MKQAQDTKNLEILLPHHAKAEWRAIRQTLVQEAVVFHAVESLAISIRSGWFRNSVIVAIVNACPNVARLTLSNGTIVRDNDNETQIAVTFLKSFSSSTGFSNDYYGSLSSILTLLNHETLSVIEELDVCDFGGLPEASASLNMNSWSSHCILSPD